MFCKHCGTSNDPGAQFCKGCGAPMSGSANYRPEQTQQYSGNSGGSSVSSSAIITGIIAVAAIAVVGILAYNFVLPNMSPGNTNTNTTQTQTADQGSNSGNSGGSTTTVIVNPGNNETDSEPEPDPTPAPNPNSTCTVTISTRTAKGTPISSSFELGSNRRVLSDTSIHRYSKSELSSLNNLELCIARNEIWATHGYQFNNSALQNYFETYASTWYTCRYTQNVKLSKTESHNVDLINSVEKSRGSKWVNLVAY